MKRWLKTNWINILLSVLITIPICIMAERSRMQPESNEITRHWIVEKIAAPEMEMQVIVIEPEQEPEPEPISLGEFKLTAYCSCEKCCGRWAKNRPVDSEGNQIVIGSTGEVLIQGESIAVDPEVIPYGSTVIINGQAFKAQDCGGSIKENRIDVYFSNHQEALEFGVQHAEVFMMKGE